MNELPLMRIHECHESLALAVYVKLSVYVLFLPKLLSLYSCRREPLEREETSSKKRRMRLLEVSKCHTC
jgi:hypothetical protein